jgi:hypothetical protein
VSDGGVRYVDPYDVTVIPMAKLPLQRREWQRLELDEWKMCLIVESLPAPFVVPLSEIVGVCNPSGRVAALRFSPVREPKMPVLYQKTTYDSPNLAVVFRSPKHLPLASAFRKFWRGLPSAPIDGFRVSVADWPEASEAFADMGVTTAATLPELLFAAVGGTLVEDMDTHERRQLWRRLWIRRVLSLLFFVGLIAISIFLKTS